MLCFRRNVTYSAISQGIGFSFGYVSIFISFIVLDSKDFCNLIRSVPQDRGFVTFSGEYKIKFFSDGQNIDYDFNDELARTMKLFDGRERGQKLLAM